MNDKTKVQRVPPRKGWYTPREIAAGFIEAFANGTICDPYSWDDFETGPEQNPEVLMALRLCWYVAERFPARSEREYMHPQGKPYLQRIAKLLRDGEIGGMVHFDLEEMRRMNSMHEIDAILGFS